MKKIIIKKIKHRICFERFSVIHEILNWWNNEEKEEKEEKETNCDKNLPEKQKKKLAQYRWNC